MKTQVNGNVYYLQRMMFTSTFKETIIVRIFLLLNIFVQLFCGHFLSSFLWLFSNTIWKLLLEIGKMDQPKFCPKFGRNFGVLATPKILPIWPTKIWHYNFRHVSCSSRQGLKVDKLRIKGPVQSVTIIWKNDIFGKIMKNGAFFYGMFWIVIVFEIIAFEILKLCTSSSL